MASGLAQRGLPCLPKELLTNILRIVHEEDEFYHQEFQTDSEGLILFDDSALLPLRSVCRAWRGAGDDAVRYFSYNFAPCRLSSQQVAQQSLWWGFVLHNVLPRWQNLATVKLVFDWKASYLRFVLQALRQNCPTLETLLLQADPSTAEHPASPEEDPQIRVLAPLSRLSSLTLMNFKVFAGQWTTGLPPLSSLTDLQMTNGSFDHLELPPGLTLLDLNNIAGNLLSLQMESARALLSLTLRKVAMQKLLVPPTLHTLDLSDLVLGSFTSGPLLALTSLRVEDTGVGDLAWLCDSSKLTILRLESLENVIRLPPLSHMTDLRKVCLRALPGLHDLPPLHCLPSLTYLMLDKCGLLQSLPRLPPSLRTLRLWKLLQLSSMEELVSAPYLKNLNIQECPRVVSLPDLSPLQHVRRVTLRGVGLSSLQGLGMLCNTMHTLHISNLGELSTLGSLSTLSCLRELRVSRCERLEQVGPLLLPKLACLDLEGCANVKKVSLAGLPNIRRTHLTSCRATVLEGLQEMPKLKTLSVSGCVNLTRLAIGPGLSRLESLDIVECAALKSVVGVSHLPEFARVSIKIKTGSITKAGESLQIFASGEEVTAAQGDESDGVWGNSSDEEEDWE